MNTLPRSVFHTTHTASATRATGRHAAAALLALLTTAASAGHPGISACPGSALFATSAAPDAERISVAQPLRPGSTLATPGSALQTSPELAGVKLLSKSAAFSFNTPSGPVSGKVVTMVVNADDASCDLYWQVHVDASSAGRIGALTLRGYDYQAGKPLFADHRSDLKGLVAPDQVSRSGGRGSTIRFRIAQGLGAGEVSTRMFLNTRIGAVASTGDLQVHGVGGGSSARVATHMPSPP